VRYGYGERGMKRRRASRLETRLFIKRPEMSKSFSELLLAGELWRSGVVF